MRRLALAALACAFALVMVPASKPEARGVAAGQIVRGIVGSADDLARLATAGRNALVRMPPRALAGVGHRERADFERAYRLVAAPHNIPKEAQKRLLDRAIDLAATPTLWTERLPLNSRLPHVYIRAPRDARVGSVLRAFAQARLERVLRAPMQTEKIRVVTLNLANDAGTHASEAAKFRTLLPSRNLDRVGSLARLSPDQVGDKGAIARAMEPYRGQTVILVGHVERGRFSVRGAGGGTRSLEIESWLEAARNAGVDLIPIGCNSAKLADIGSQGLINSARVRDGLRRVLSGNPKTTEEMLGLLTGPDLRLVIDPFGTRLFGQTAVLTDRAGVNVGSIAGNLGTIGSRAAIRVSDSIQSASRASDYSACFSRPTPEGFDACATTQVAAARERALQFKQDCVNELRAAEVAARAVLSGAGSQFRLALALYGAVIALLIYLVAIYPAARHEEVENGGSRAVLFKGGRMRDLAVSGRLVWILPLLLIGLGVTAGMLTIAYFGDFATFWTLQTTLILITAMALVRLLGEAAAQGSLIKTVLAVSIAAYCGAGLYAHARASTHSEAGVRFASAAHEIGLELDPDRNLFPTHCEMELAAEMTLVDRINEISLKPMVEDHWNSF